MTDKKTEALKLALEALEHWMRIDTVEDIHIFETVTAPEAIAVLRKALEQEPWDTTDMAYRPGGLSMEQDEIVPSDYSGVTGDYSGVTGDYMEQEPVAWRQSNGIIEPVYGVTIPIGSPLYTAPPKREWVGLTDDEVNEFAAGCHLGNSVQGAIYKAQAKLKEKNT